MPFGPTTTTFWPLFMQLQNSVRNSHYSVHKLKPTQLFAASAACHVQQNKLYFSPKCRQQQLLCIQLGARPGLCGGKAVKPCRENSFFNW